MLIGLKDIGAKEFVDLGKGCTLLATTHTCIGALLPDLIHTSDDKVVERLRVGPKCLDVVAKLGSVASGLDVSQLSHNKPRPGKKLTHSMTVSITRSSQLIQSW